ncbi:MAG TPA: MFS transporter [Xanthobacteraceae bacterium]|nr:MFS transporter [Xanthobacteraceae bacterium]
MNRVLAVVAFASFASSMFIRMTDPLVPQVATEFGVDVSVAALLGTAFAAPWALMQPILGPLGDLLGKTRVIQTCLFILVASAVVGALATSFPMLVGARVLAGAAAGGVFPVSMAVYGDMVPIEQRQIGMGRLLTASISGMFVGSAAAGALADFLHWRGIFVVYGACALLAAVGAAFALRGAASPPRRVNVTAMIENYAKVWSNPRSKICYLAVFAEGVALVGLFPFVAVLLVSIGESRASIAGLVLAAFPIGGVIYSLAVGQIVPRFTTRSLMIFGGLLAAAALIIQATIPPWPVQVAIFLVMGFGFYLLHGCILVQMTELAPQARGTAVAGHALAYFSGQAVGPVAYGIGLAAIGAPATILLAALTMVLVGTMTAHLLHGRGRT